MTITLTRQRETKPGAEARRLRISLNISRRELAAMARVSLEAVNQLEHNYPLPLEYRRRILKELWAVKARSGA